MKYLYLFCLFLITTQLQSQSFTKDNSPTLNKAGSWRSVASIDFDNNYSVTEACGLKDTTCQNVDLTMFSTEELLWMNSLDIYPNPATDQLIMESSSRLEANIQPVLYDIQGKKVLAKTYNQDSQILKL